MMKLIFVLSNTLATFEAQFMKKLGTEAEATLKRGVSY